MLFAILKEPFQKTMISTILLLLSILGPVLSTNCPPAKDISPCTCGVRFDHPSLSCHDADISLNDLKKFLNIFEKKDALSLSLHSIKLGAVPFDFFKGFNIRLLKIAQCTLDSFAGDGEEPLSGLEATLERLIITSSFTEDNVAVTLKVSHLSRLVEFNLDYNSISELSDDWFEDGPSSLTRVILYNNDITNLGRSAFVNLRNLQGLWLQGNRFGELHRSMLPNPASNLYYLYLDNNALNSLPEDFFTGMPLLRTVSLDNNKLTVLPQKTFQPAWENLHWIVVTANPLDCDDSVLEWIIEAKEGPEIRGTCNTPPERAGMELAKLIKKND